MSDPGKKTREGQLLDRHPEVREAVLAAEDFQQWRSELPSLIVDGTLYYLHWGDTFRDEDQIVYEWALRRRLLSGFPSQLDENI